MIFNDLFTTRGIFADVFKPTFPDLYTKVFGTNDPAQLDAFTRLKYGSRELLQAVTSDSYTVVLSAIITMNADKWGRVADVLSISYDVVNPVVRETEHSSNTEQSTSEDNENLNAKKSFNDVEFNDGERDKTTRDGSTQRTERYTTTETGVGYTRPLSEIIRKEKDLRADDYRRAVIEEIINEITLTIYS